MAVPDRSSHAGNGAIASAGCLSRGAGADAGGTGRGVPVAPLSVIGRVQQLPPQLAVAAGAFLIAYFLPGLRLTFATILILAGIAGVGVFARHESSRIAALPAYAAEAGGSPLRLMAFNVHLPNTNAQAVAEEVERQDPMWPC